MSKVIDERVVEMRFDNVHFEKNVNTTLSTLDKLKESLKLSDASQGLQNLGSIAGKLSFSGISDAVHNVSAKFSALEIAGITAMSRITNAAITAGKNIVNSLTVAPITQGWSEYELKMSSVQTIMYSTGESLETVNKYLDELNEYSDQTIYSFSDMTQNIGKFTNAGVKLGDAVNAIKGVSNVAALSGANANEASRAMYNFAQALSAGYVKLIDWKSIENANMATVDFKEELIKTALEFGTLEKTADGMYRVLTENAAGSSMKQTISATSNFNDSLNYQWMTTEVLINTLQKYTDTTTDIGKKATQAATEVKTFRQMLDTLRESAQSGWAQTWEIIFGDFNQGKELWTSINNVVGGFIDKMSDARNTYLTRNLSKTATWGKFEDAVKDAGGSLEDFQKQLKKVVKKGGKDLDALIKKEGSLDKVFEKGLVTKKQVLEALDDYTKSIEKNGQSTKEQTDALKYYQKMFNEVWNGDWKNGQARIEALTEAGHDYADIQSLVNKYTAGHKITLDELSEAQLIQLGYTKKEIKALEELSKQAKDSNTSLGEMLESMSKPSGRDLLIQSFKNIGKAIQQIIDVFKGAWTQVFGDKDPSKDMSLYNAISEFEKLTSSMQLSEDKLNALGSMMTAFVTSIDFGWKFGTKALLSFLKIVDALFKVMGTDLFQVVDMVCDRFVDFVNWFRTKTIFDTKTQWQDLAKIIIAIYNGLKKCITAFIGLDKVKKFIDDLNSAFREIFGNFEGGILDIASIENMTKAIEALFTRIETWIKGIDQAKNVGMYIILGLTQGITSTAQWAFDAIVKIAKTIIGLFSTEVDVNSPSKVFFQIGKWIMLGLLGGIWSYGPKEFQDAAKRSVKGLYDGIFSVVNRIQSIMEAFSVLIVDIAQQINLSTILATGFGIAGAMAVFKAIDLLGKFVNPLVSIGKMADKIGSAFKDVGESMTKWFNAKVWAVRANILLRMAVAVGILALAVGFLTKVAAYDSKAMWNAVGAIAALTVAVVVLSFACEKLTKNGDFTHASVSLLAIAGSLAILALSVKVLSTIAPEQMESVLIGMISLIGGILGLLFLTKKMKISDTKDLVNIGWMLIQMSSAILIISIAMKQLAELSLIDTLKGVAVIAAIGLIFAGMTALMKLTSKAGGFSVNGVGGSLLGMTVAMGLMILIVKMAAGVDSSTLAAGLKTVGFIGLIFAGIIVASKFAGSHALASGGMMLAMSIAMGVMVAVIKAAANVDSTELTKSLVTIGYIGMIFAAIVGVSYFAGEHAAKAGTMLVLMSGAMLALTASVAILGMLPSDVLAKGVTAVSVLLGMYALLISSTSKMSGDIMKNLIVMTITIVALASAAALLCLIDTKTLLGSVGGLSALMLSFSIMMTAAGKIGDVSAKSLAKVVGSMLITVGIMAAILAIMSHFVQDPKTAISSAVALGTVMLALAGALVIISSIKSAPTALSGLFTELAIIMAEIAILIAMMANAIPPESAGSAIASATALGVVLNALSTSMMILGFAKLPTKINPSIWITMGVALAAVAIVLGTLATLKVETSIKSATSLSILLLALSSAMVPLAMAGMFGDVALMSGLKAFGILMAAISVIAILVGALEQLTEGRLTKTLDSAILVAEKIGLFIGSFIGGIFGGVASGAFAGLEKSAEHLSGFMDKANDFFEHAKNINQKAVDGVKKLAETLLILSGTAFIDNILSFGNLFGRSNIRNIGDDLACFGRDLAGFSNAVAGKVDSTAVTAAAKAGNALADMAAALPNSGGIFSWFTGNNNLDKFGERLESYGTALTTFSNEVTKEGGINVIAIQNAADASRYMSNMAKHIPNSGGLISGFTGDNDLLWFGTSLVLYGLALTTFSKQVAKEGGINVKAIQNAADASVFVVNMAKDIPNSGGIFSWFTGDNKLDTFGDQLEAFGTGIVKLSNAVSEGEINKENIQKAADAAGPMVELANTLPEGTGWFKKWTTGGTTSIDEFVSQIGSFLEGLSSASSKLSTTTFAEDKIDQAASIGTKLAEIPKMLVGTEGYNIGTFGENLKTFAKNLSGFNNNLPDKEDLDEDRIDKVIAITEKLVGLQEKVTQSGNTIGSFGQGIGNLGDGLNSYNASILSVNTDKMDKVTTTVDELATVASGITSDSIDNLETFADSMEQAGIGLEKAGNSFNKFGTDVIDRLTKVFSGSHTTVVTSINTLISKIAGAIESKENKNKTTSAINMLCGSAASAIDSEDNVKKFTQSGKDLTQGLINGLKDPVKLQAVYDAAFALGQEAVAGEKAGQNSESPSKDTYQAGLWVGEGLINGMVAMGNKVYNAGHSIGEEATNSISNTVSRIADAINTDIDSQPTIRPVLDLSDIQNGANSINNMFGLSPSVGALSTAYGINSRMNALRQNGANDDVVNAINNLNGRLDNVGGTSYNINGINYGGDSAVAEAIETIVRAIKIEGRM